MPWSSRSSKAWRPGLRSWPIGSVRSAWGPSAAGESRSQGRRERRSDSATAPPATVRPERLDA
jgi:hypothetical protein